MCHKVTCTKCGKPTWAGCGRHIETALAGVFFFLLLFFTRFLNQIDVNVQEMIVKVVV